MTEQKEKKQTKSAAGYLFIAAGVVGIVSRFIGEVSWGTVSVIKLCIYILAVAGGLWIVLKKK